MEPTWQDIEAKLGDPRFRLVDVLAPGMFARLHIPGAVNLPLSDIPSRASEVLPDKDAEIVTYCSGPL